MGGRLRRTPDRAAADPDAADVPRRHVLLDQYAAAVLAEGDALQSRRLPGQRLPVELLRNIRRQRRVESADDARVSDRLPCRRMVDLQDGLSAEGLTSHAR